MGAEGLIRKRITRTQTAFRTPWFELKARKVQGEKHPYYALTAPDYVSVVARDSQGRYILVRQFRPAPDRVTLELPSGTVDKGYSPAATARKELFEETGYRCSSLRKVGVLIPDTGRMMNRLWVYEALDCRPVPGAGPEAGIECVLANADQLRRLIRPGRFDHALNVAALALTGFGMVHRPKS